MLDIHPGLIQEVLATRHAQLERDQRMHRLATSARSARAAREVRPRRRLVARPAT